MWVRDNTAIIKLPVLVSSTRDSLAVTPGFPHYVDATFAFLGGN